MTLAEYLRTKTLTATAFADQCGLPVSVVTRLLRGERGASLKTALAIEAATGGEVKPTDLSAPSPSAHEAGEAA